MSERRDIKVDSKRMEKRESKKGKQSTVYNQKHIRIVEALVEKKTKAQGEKKKRT